MPVPVRLPLAVLVALAVMAAACAAPPTKELSLAEGGIEAARAARPPAVARGGHAAGGAPQGRAHPRLAPPGEQLAQPEQQEHTDERQR